VARPMPDEAPVTMTTLSAIFTPASLHTG